MIIQRTHPVSCNNTFAWKELEVGEESRVNTEYVCFVHIFQLMFLVFITWKGLFLGDRILLGPYTVQKMGHLPEQSFEFHRELKRVEEKNISLHGDREITGGRNPKTFLCYPVKSSRIWTWMAVPKSFQLVSNFLIAMVEEKCGGHSPWA